MGEYTQVETQSLERSLKAYGQWMIDSALPFWLTTGYDGPGRGFVEHLGLDAKPATISFKRVRVQARQIYVYSHAAILGWSGGLAAAEETFAFTVTNGWHPEGGWIRKMGRCGGIVDPTVDLYDVAFMMFAAAWHYRATKSAACITWANRTLDWLETKLRVPNQLGFENTLPADNTVRQQNPHMHLLEASLALYEATKNERFAVLADDLLELFRTKLFDEKSGTIAELFDPTWMRRRDPDTSTFVEPGHQFEWTWLLFEAYRILGTDLRPHARALYSFATKYGTEPTAGMILDSVDELGQVQDRSTRLWPQTEAMKAHLAMLEYDHVSTGALVEQCTNNLMTQFLSREPIGTWTDHFASDGRPKGERIPTSSLYHLHLSYAELRRVTEALTVKANPFIDRQTAGQAE
jgi:mannose/cellobiose epimerase-like protein (N-acyl-D-glucosamine 2-epimerase family)